jgi:tetratricopeptide (TPR) repeat protein
VRSKRARRSSAGSPRARETRASSSSAPRWPAGYNPPIVTKPARASRAAKPRGSSAGTILLAALSLGFVVRIVYFREIARLPFFEAPIIDGAEYLRWARHILGGEILWSEVPIHGPVYPYVLALLLGLSGGSLAFATLAQFLIGLVCVWLHFRVARRHFGDAVAGVAALLAATYVPFLYFEGLILATPFILVINLFLLDRLGSLPRTPSTRDLVVPGVLLGLSIATHPAAGTLLVAIPAWLAARTLRARPAGAADARAGARALRPALLFAAGSLAIVLPIVARNAALGGGTVLQRNLGKNFYIGMGPTADGTANVPPGVEWERLRRQAWEAGTRTPAEETRYFLREALGFAARDPGAALGLVARKIYLFASGIHVDASQDFRFFRQNAPLLALPAPAAAVVVPLGLLGLVRFGRRAPLLLVYVAAYLVSVSAFAFATRYALPAHPVFVILAAAALVDLARAARARRLAAVDVALLGAFFLVANVDPLGLRARRLLHPSGHIAKILYDAGRFEQAAAVYERAAAEYPGDPDIHNGWGITLDRLGQRDAARSQYEAALAAAPDHFEARFNLAAHAQEEGRLAEAESAYREAIASAPWRADTRLNLGVAYAQMDSLDLAAAQLDTALLLDPDYREAALNLASIESRRNAPDRAAAIYRRLLAKKPSAELATDLGAALEQAGDHLGAQEAFRSALRIEPDHAGALYKLGMNLAGFQRYEEAIAMWKRVLEREPRNEAAQAAIDEARARLAARRADGDTSSAGARPPDASPVPRAPN